MPLFLLRCSAHVQCTSSGTGSNRALLPAAFCVRLAAAATAQVFALPSKSLLVQTANYTSFSNTALSDGKVVKGKHTENRQI